MGVSDALAGKTVRCSACGEGLLVTAAAQPAAKAGGRSQSASPAFYMSRGKTVALALLAGLVILGIAFYFGPVRVWHDWAEMEPKASGTIRHLVIVSLTAHAKMEEDQDFDPRARRRQPTVESHDLSFFQPILAFTMPDVVSFVGKSNQGTFGGTYNTRTGKVDATVSYGGYSVAGIVDIGKPKGTFHLVGRVVDGQPDAEIDGKKI